MRRLISILIVTGTVLAVAQAAVAQVETIPITVTSQTLQVRGFGMSTGGVTGGSSVGTSWNLGNEDGSTVGSVTSEVIDGELVITLVGALSKSATAGVATVEFEIDPFVIGFVVPGTVVPIFVQTTKANSELVGPIESNGFSIYPSDSAIFYTGYSSLLLGGLVRLGYIWAEHPTLDTPVALPLGGLLPNDSISEMAWGINRSLRVNVNNSTSTFSETFIFRALPEPSASLTIPSGAAMLLALSKLRGVSLIH
jgi:hypothetical protein